MRLPFILLIAGIGIALGGAIRLWTSDEVALPMFLIVAGGFLGVVSWNYIKRPPPAD